MSQHASAAPIAQYLSFFLAGEEYALGILQVREIINYGTVTRVPGMPAWVQGVTNLRGSVLPVIDLAVKFGLPPCALTRRTCIVVVEGLSQGEPLVVGLLGEAVGQVLELGPGDIEPPPAFGMTTPANALLGMGRSGKKFILLLDIHQLLGSLGLVAVGTLAQDGSGEVP